MNTSNKYKEDGVDISTGDLFSKFCGDIARSTYENSNFVQVTDLSKGNFRGPRGFVWKNLPDGCLSTGAVDGIGTKVVLLSAAHKLLSSASNIIAMTAMDITRYGGLPLLFMNILDVRSLGEIDSDTYNQCVEIMSGLKILADEHKYVIFTGETAEIGLCVGSENPDSNIMFNWGGTMLGVYQPDKMIYGDTLRPGQIIVALKDYFRSNGISSVRKALAIKYGKNWWSNPEAMADIIATAEPAVQYDRFLNYAHGWLNKDFRPIFNLHLIIHLSGGGIESKFGRDMLEPLGLSADLDDLFTPPEIMQDCANWRGMDDEECYSTWNGGQGALVVIDEDQKDFFLLSAQSFNIEAKVVGKIIEKKDYNVAVKSKFKKNDWIYYK